METFFAGHPYWALLAYAVGSTASIWGYMKLFDDMPDQIRSVRELLANWAYLGASIYLISFLSPPTWVGIVSLAATIITYGCIVKNIEPGDDAYSDIQSLGSVTTIPLMVFVYWFPLVLVPFYEAVERPIRRAWWRLKT